MKLTKHMKLTKQQAAQIKDYFSIQPDILAVYLYGSFAKGTTHPRSDIDLGILFKGQNRLKNFHRLADFIDGLYQLKLANFPKEIDVRDVYLNQSPMYLMNVISGQVVYSRNENDRIKFEVLAMNQFYDTQRFRDISYEYMKKRLEEGRYGY